MGRRPVIAFFAFLALVASLAFPGAAAALAPVSFRPSRGFRDAPFRLVLSAPEAGVSIRFTLDGSAPSAAGGRVYEGPIEIARTTVVRAVAVTAEGAAGPVATHTYLFPAQTIEQPARPAGYVTSFLSERLRRPLFFDYALDPRIANDPASGDLAAHLRALPSISLALDRDDFNTLYRNHRARGAAWERPVSMELIYPPGERYAAFAGFQIDCGIRMQGGLAVDQARKKSFRVLFKRRYGRGTLRYPLFESAVHHAASAARRFETVVLRAGGNANWSKETAFKHAPCTYLRDQLVRDSEIAMRGIGSRGIFAHLWINGLYFGLYNVCERPDARFLAAYLGGEASDYCALKPGDILSGDASRWRLLERTLRAMARDPAARLEALRRIVDLPAFCDYVLLNWYAGTGDWPWHNWYAGIRNDPPGRALFLCWDAELAFWARPGYHNSSPGAWVNPIFTVAAPGAPPRRRGPPQDPIRELWSVLAASEEFRLLFADRVARHCLPGGALCDERMRARFTRLAARIEDAIVAESARWGDATEGTEARPRTRERDWYPARDAILSMIDGNAARFIAALRRAGLYPRADPPVIVRAAPDPARPGAVAALLRAPPGAGTIFFTTDGTDPRRPGSGEVSAPARAFEGGAPLLLDGPVRIKARVRGRGGWSALADRLLLPGGEGLPLRVTELMYHPASGEEHEFIEIANVSSAPVELTGLRLTGVRYRFPPGSELRGGGRIVLTPDDDPASFARRYPGVTVFGRYRGHLSNAGETIAIADAAGRTIFAVAYDDESPWPEAPDGTAGSLELVDLSSARPGAAAWRASAAPGGTPGRAR